MLKFYFGAARKYCYLFYWYDYLLNTCGCSTTKDLSGGRFYTLRLRGRSAQVTFPNNSPMLQWGQSGCHPWVYFFPNATLRACHLYINRCMMCVWCLLVTKCLSQNCSHKMWQTNTIHRYSTRAVSQYNVSHQNCKSHPLKLVNIDSNVRILWKSCLSKKKVFLEEYIAMTSPPHISCHTGRQESGGPAHKIAIV